MQPKFTLCIDTVRKLLKMEPPLEILQCPGFLRVVRSREKREREVSEQAFSGFMIFSVSAAAASTFFLAPLSEMSSSQVDPTEACALNVETHDNIKQLT